MLKSEYDRLIAERDEALHDAEISRSLINRQGARIHDLNLENERLAKMVSEEEETIQSFLRAARAEAKKTDALRAELAHWQGVVADANEHWHQEVEAARAKLKECEKNLAIWEAPDERW